MPPGLRRLPGSLGPLLGVGSYSAVYGYSEGEAGRENDDLGGSGGRERAPPELAVKVLTSDRAEAFERLQREYDALCRMERECAASGRPCYTVLAKGVFLSASGRCMILERHGETLEAFISGELRFLSPDARTHVFSRICSDLILLAIQLARSEMVWTDVSSRNILLRADWRERSKRAGPPLPLVCAVDLELAGPPGVRVNRPMGTPKFASVLFGGSKSVSDEVGNSNSGFPNPEQCVTCFEGDLESFVYLMVDFLTQKLLWRNARAPGGIRAIKCRVMSGLDEYLKGLPQFLLQLWNIVLDHHVRGIKRSKSQYLSELEAIRAELDGEGRGGLKGFSPGDYEDRSPEFAAYDGIPLFSARARN